jgi:cytoskeletal protein CcmA (bactofilin family)
MKFLGGKAAFDLTLVGGGCRIVGSVAATGDARIDGAVEGPVSAGGRLIVGRDGSVAGDVSAREVIVGGRIDGAVAARERVVLEPSAIVHGDVRAPKITVDEGASIDGACRTETAAAEIILNHES